MKTLATKITALFLAVVCGAGIASMRRAGAEEAKNSNGIIGDVDLNSKIDIQDATELQIYLAENSELSANQLTIADVNLDGKTNIRDVTCIQRYLSGYTGSEIGKELDENRLPDYCLREIESVKRQISASAGSDDVVFGVFTDLHFAENDTEASYTQKINAVRSMRRLADVSSLDFVIQGGDLLTYNTYDESVKRITEVNEIFAGSKAPLLNSKGDHDSSQSGDKKMTVSEYNQVISPYMPNAVQCADYPTNYYFDIPTKKTRVINIDTGTLSAGQGRYGEEYKTWSNEVLFNWLLNEVLTNDVKDGWSFIVFSHSPLDYEYQFGMAKRFRNTNPEDVISSQNLAKGNLIAINDLFNAINGKKTFTTKKTAAILPS